MPEMPSDPSVTKDELTEDLEATEEEAEEIIGGAKKNVTDHNFLF